MVNTRVSPFISQRRYLHTIIWRGICLNRVQASCLQTFAVEHSFEPFDDWSASPSVKSVKTLYSRYIKIYIKISVGFPRNSKHFYFPFLALFNLNRSSFHYWNTLYRIQMSFYVGKWLPTFITIFSSGRVWQMAICPSPFPSLSLFLMYRDQTYFIIIAT